MALRTDFTNATLLQDVHPLAHNDTNAAVNALSTVQAWQTPTLQNGWVTDGAPWTNPPGYYKDPFGRVYLRGAITSGTADLIFTLPAGYRPPFVESQCVITAGGAAAKEVRVDEGGNVYGIGHPANLRIDGVSFRAA